MITEQKKLELLLGGLNAQLLGFSAGEDALSDEEMARVIRKSIIAIRRQEPGAFREIDLSY